MAKNFYFVVMTIVVAALSFTFTSCDKYEDTYALDLHPQENPGDNTKKEIVITPGRDGDNVTIEAEETEDGTPVRDTTITVPMGRVNFTITPLDTIYVESAVVSNVSFKLVSTDIDEGFVPENAVDGVTYTKTTKTYLHTLNGYTKEIVIDYLDGKMTVWGKEVIFPAANGAVAFNNGISDIIVSDEGINGDYHYFLATTIYEVAFMKGSFVEKGFERLAIKKDDVKDELISTVKSAEGYETLTSTPANGTGESWIEITRTYTVSEPTVTRVRVILNNGIASPAYGTIILPSFVLNQISANLGAANASGNRTEGDIVITEFTQNYVVGNDKFNKTFGLSYEKAVWSDGTNTFEMPYRVYENITDKGFVMDAMDAVEGYERELNTHSISATFNGHSVMAKAETEVRVREEEKPIENDEMISRNVIDEGFDYVNDNASNTWVEIEEEWSVSGKKTYLEKTGLVNGITVPASIQKFMADFNLSQINATLGNAVLVNTATVGKFTIRTYNVKYTVGNDRFTREFVLSYQTAVYNPLNYDMPSKTYENISDNGFTTADMSNATLNGKVYTRKGYTHNMAATFNGHNATASALAELLVEVVIPRQVPSWMGAPVKATYTRVQTSVGSNFMDMVNFEYQNGNILAPNGVVDMNLMFANNATTASAQGVKYAQKGTNSAVRVNNTWEPAVIHIQGSFWRYVSGCAGNTVHTVNAANAVGRGIGVEVTPIPSNQSCNVDGDTITVKYNKDNKGNTVNSSLSLR